MLSNSKWFEEIETIKISILDQKKFRDFHSQWSSDYPSIFLLVFIITSIREFKGFFFIRSIISSKFSMNFRISILSILNTENSMSFIYDELFLNDQILFNDELVIVVRPWIPLFYFTFKQVVTFSSTENWQVEQLLLLIRFWYLELHGCSTQWYSSKSELLLYYMMFWTISTNTHFDKDRCRSTKTFNIYIYIYISYTYRIMDMIHRKLKFVLPSVS